ncbi:hypothetical protein EAH68_01285 [Corynebacterium hylobatis]|uniref:DUF6457 domain-containing protein n=1 Tax=Corynebacterium hylobatis TaxID=1859290 RepID=A0A430I148_9CORY|nr:DUF6457 domain-containing protein [Corynebacterium hylobatis]RSZ65424.1 hypothetical protein EAH68_01285 [Corynebacterium hylobatis]
MSAEKSGQDLSEAKAWLEQVSGELGLAPEIIEELLHDLLDLTRDVAHGPSRPAAPLTAFLVGLASGRALTADMPDEGAVDKSRENITRVLDLLDNLST